MHIYIIALYLDHDGQEDDRLYKLGREYVEWGHEVTIFTGLNNGKFKLEKKKIGLQSAEGINYVTFNVNYEHNMPGWRKLYNYLKFARLAGRQGRQMPKPDLIFALSPPLTTVLPAIKLGRYYRVPLVTEIRKLWSVVPAEVSNQPKRVLNAIVNKLEKKIYQNADRIIAADEDLIKAIREKLGEDDQAKKVTAIAGESEDKEMLESYDDLIASLLKNKD
jgi:hypothetical protein